MERIAEQLNKAPSFTAESLIAADAAVAITESRRPTNRPLDEMVHRYRPQPDRFDPRAEESALLDLQQAIAGIQLAYDATGSHRKTNSELAEDLNTLANSIPYKDPEGNAKPALSPEQDALITWKDAQDAKDEAIAEINRIMEGFINLEGTRSEIDKQRDQLNFQSIITHNNLIKINLKQAAIATSTKKPPGFAKSNIKQALAACFDLATELNYRKTRATGSNKKREIATADYFGRTTWALKPSALDIEVGEEKTIIRRGLWLHPRSRIRTVVNNYINIDSLESIDRDNILNDIDELTSLYPAVEQQSLFSTGNSAAIRAGLIEIRESIAAGSNDAKDLRAKVKAVRKLIPEGYCKYIRRDISHAKDPGAGKRSIGHTLTSYIKATEDTIEMKCNSQHGAYILRKATASKFMNKKTKDALKELLGILISKKYSVPEKTTANKRLKAIIGDEKTPGKIDQAYKLQSKDKEQAAKAYAKIANELYNPKLDEIEDGDKAIDRNQIERIKTIAGLYRNRILAIPGIVGATLKKLDALFIDTKDSDLSGSAARLVELFKEGSYSQAMSLIAELNEFYLKYNSPEPGYQRAKASFVRIYQLAEEAEAGNGKANAIEEIEELRDLIIADVEHKFNSRYIVLDLENESPQRKYIYAMANSSLSSLPKQIGGKVKRQYIRNPANGDLQEATASSHSPLSDKSAFCYQVSDTAASNTNKFKDAKMLYRASKLADLSQSDDYQTVAAEAAQLKQLYFTGQSFASPGHSRIYDSLNTIEQIARRRTRNEQSQQQIKRLVNLIALDFDHKDQYRITIIDRDDTIPHQKYVFTALGQYSEADLLKQINKNHISLKSPERGEARGYRSIAETQLDLIDSRTYFVSQDQVTNRSAVFDSSPPYVQGVKA